MSATQHFGLAGPGWLRSVHQTSIPSHAVCKQHSYGLKPESIIPWLYAFVPMRNRQNLRQQAASSEVAPQHWLGKKQGGGGGSGLIIVALDALSSPLAKWLLLWIDLLLRSQGRFPTRLRMRSMDVGSCLDSLEGLCILEYKANEAKLILFRLRPPDEELLLHRRPFVQ